jgi:glycerol uptake facilitator-like aquaporin
MTEALGTVTRGVNPTIGPFIDPDYDGSNLGRVFDAFSLREHLKDQSFDSKEGGWLLWEFVKTQAIPVVAGEFIASMIFSVIITIAFSFSTGVAVSLPGGLVSVALASWFACQLVIGKLGHVSGAHVNPMVSFLLYLMHLTHYIFTGGLYLFLRDTILLMLYWTGQFGGWFAGVGIAWYMIGDSSATANLSLPALGFVDGDEIGWFKGLFIETFMVAVYLGVYAFGVVDRKMKERYAGHLMGITLAAITLVSVSLTGANFNMLRWLATYAITGRPSAANWGVYIFASWIAVPIVFVAIELWRRFIEPTTVGRVTTMTAPDMPPKNKYHSALRIAACAAGAPYYTPENIKKQAEENRQRTGLVHSSGRAQRRRGRGAWQ